MRTDVRRTGAVVMDGIGLAANALVLVVSIWACLHLWRMGWDYVAFAGGLPEPSLQYAWAVINAPELPRRLGYWAGAWASWIFSGGFALLSIAGLHWAWHALRSMLD